MKNTEASPWQQSLKAAKANALPGFFLQCLALTVVLSYYYWPTAQIWLDQLAEWKNHWGYAYSMVSTALFGGLIPFVFLRAHPATRAHTPGMHLVFYVLYWAYKGLEVDALYRAQAWMFGNDTEVWTIVSKVVFDQFVYNIFWSAPFGLILFHWKEMGFSRKSIVETNWAAYLRKALPSGLISTWGIWIPTVAVIYCLPQSLQVPLFNIVLCFFVLIWASLTRRTQETP
jgi:multisubunit Na+/H+ antiporter MnhG subunit